MADPVPDLLLRPAEASDADALVDLHLAARREAAMPPIADPGGVRNWLGGRLRDTDDEVWLAEVRGVPAGYARVTSYWLADLYVDPRHQRHGVGTALLDLVKALRPGGFCLWVFEMNAPARELYRRHGLVELERTDGHANQEKTPDVKLAWPGAEPLAFFRRLIDEVDGELGDLLARRVALTRAAQGHKAAPGRDPARESEIAAAMAGRAPELGAERLARIVQAIITESLDAVAGQNAEITK
jgi:GNAT superfamily N-acetyltransferase/chorismate mutase